MEIKRNVVKKIYLAYVRPKGDIKAEVQPRLPYT